MARYLMVVTEAYETVAPASEMVFTSLVSGEEVGKRLPVPESRFSYAVGYRYVAQNKTDRDRLLKTGKWKYLT